MTGRTRRSAHWLSLPPVLATRGIARPCAHWRLPWCRLLRARRGHWSRASGAPSTPAGPLPLTQVLLPHLRGRRGVFGLADLAARGTIVASTLVLCTDCLRGFYTLWVRHASTLPRLRVKPAIWTDPPPDSEAREGWLKTGA